MKRIERVRLYPTPSQVQRLQFALDVTRELYNALLQHRRDAYRYRRVRITAKQQYAEITALRKPIHAIDGCLAAVYRECEDAVLHWLELAFAAFFRRIKRGDTPGYPRFKPKSRWKQLEFPHGDRALKFNVGQDRARIPGFGTLRIRRGRSLPETFGRAWIVERNGRWYLCLEHEVEPAPRREVKRVLGVDCGVHVLAATSEGRLIANARVLERRRGAVTRLQRSLEERTHRDAAGRCTNRRDPGRIAAAKRLARAKDREANARRDYLDKVSRSLVASADCIALESLNLRGRTRSAKGKVAKPARNVAAKAALNRAVLDASIGQLQRMIAYKAESAGVTIIAVDARSSSQTCHKCESCERGHRRRRRFACVRCGFTTHADIAAALEIRRRAQKALLRLPDAGAEPVTLHDAA